MKRIAFLTSGGDSPGMNACIRSIVRTCYYHDIVPIGVRDGYKGMISNDMIKMSKKDVENIIHLGGTILGTARSEEFKQFEFRQKAIVNLKNHEVDGLIVIGGDGTFTGATYLSKEMNIPIIGIPGTIDNDIYGTERTIGFDTAFNTVIEAIDKIRDTATSHHRVFLVEVMGRNSGFIATNSAIASGLDMVLVPEEKTNIQELADQVKIQISKNKSCIIIVAEGDDEGGGSQILSKIKPFLKKMDIRSTVLGHLQRGGSPSAYDRLIATKMGAFAVEMLLEGKTDIMIGTKGDSITTIPILDGITYKNLPVTDDKLHLFKKY